MKQKTAQNVLETISEAFEDSTGQSFTECLTQNPKTRLQARASKQEQKKKRREQLRSYKSSIEQESSVSAVLGTRTSKSQFNKIRMIEGFQPTTQTEEATPKSHIPAIENIELGNHDEETLIAEVQTLPSDKLNWSELARKYNIKLVNSESELRNGGQVIKELLRSKGVDVDRFGEKSEKRVRRKHKREALEVRFQFQPHQPLQSSTMKLRKGLKLGFTILVSLLHPSNFQG